ncbi:MAG: SxtJ family membrane protein [Pseudomonadota bacterium]
MSGEAPVSYGRDVAMDSERSFGLVFACVFALIGFVPWLLGHGWRPWALIVAAIFLAVALVFPRLLRPLNFIWFKLGLALHHIVNPVIMALIFFGAVLPTGLMVRLFGKDLLRLKRDPHAKSYWIERVPPGPDAQSMTRQF